MIINGGSRSNARFFMKHLANGEENERVTLVEMRNLASQTIAGAFCEMEAIAMGTMCKNYFYHANINPNPKMGETISEAQWKRAADLLEENLGLTGHARFIVEHEKKHRVHRHAIWLRIDVWRMRAVEMTDDYEKHQATSRQLESEFGLAHSKSVLGPEKDKGHRPTRHPKAWETFRGHLTGIDPQAMTEYVSSLYEASKDGPAFARALREHGYHLVRGDHIDFCIMDSAGDLHSLHRRLPNVNAAELKKFMEHVHPDSWLPLQK